MAELLDPTEIFHTSFEPHVANRFIMYVEGIPSFIIKASSLPKVKFGDVVLDHINVKRYVKGKAEWDPITIKLFSPIVPSAAQAVMEWVRLSHESLTGRDGYSDFYKKDITLNLLGPVGDKTSQWDVKGAYVQSVDFGEGDWSVENPIEVTCVLRYDFAILQF